MEPHFILKWLANLSREHLKNEILRCAQNDRRRQGSTDGDISPRGISENVGELSLADVHFSGGERRQIVGFHQALIISLGILLREKERLGGVPFVINMGKIGLGIKAVIPSAAENQPFPIRTPGVKTVHIVRIDILHGFNRTAR